MKYTMPDSGASDMMWDAGLGGGGVYVLGGCGQDHTLPDHVTEEMYDRGEYQSIEYVTIDGKNFVYGCDQCSEQLSKYENFIWDNRDYIESYLKIRGDQERAWADQESTLNILIGNNP